jgi:hypothetical protein
MLRPSESFTESAALAEHDRSCSAMVEGGEHRDLLWLMAEFFRTVGYTDLKARLPGHAAPEVLMGTLEDHRPDCTCRQDDTEQTPILLEVVTPKEVDEPGRDHRWSLLASAAHLYSAELHFVVPQWSERGSIEPLLRRRLSGIDVHPSRIWSV